ncbi:MAG: MarR family transcriptional regulator [Dehalococcoidia bacterium]
MVVSTGYTTARATRTEEARARAVEPGARIEAAFVPEPLISAVLDLVVAFCNLASSDWAEIPLTMPQFKVLALVMRAERPTIGEVAQTLRVTPPTASGIVDRLASKRLVVREADPLDRRVVHVRLNGAPREVVRRLFPGAFTRLDDRLAGLTDADEDVILRAAQLIEGVPGSPALELAPLEART